MKQQATIRDDFKIRSMFGSAFAGLIFFVTALTLVDYFYDSGRLPWDLYLLMLIPVYFTAKGSYGLLGFVRGWLLKKGSYDAIMMRTIMDKMCEGDTGVLKDLVLSENNNCHNILLALFRDKVNDILISELTDESGVSIYIDRGIKIHVASGLENYFHSAADYDNKPLTKELLMAKTNVKQYFNVLYPSFERVLSSRKKLFTALEDYLGEGENIFVSEESDVSHHAPISTRDKKRLLAENMLDYFKKSGMGETESSISERMKVYAEKKVPKLLDYAKEYEKSWCCFMADYEDIDNPQKI